MDPELMSSSPQLPYEATSLQGSKVGHGEFVELIIPYLHSPIFWKALNPTWTYYVRTRQEHAKEASATPMR